MGRFGTRARWAAADATIWVLAVHLAVWFRYDFSLSLLLTWGTPACAVGVAVAHLVIGFLRGPYTTRHRLASIEEAHDVALAVGLATLGLFVTTLLIYPPPIPRSTPLVSGSLALLSMFALRFLRRAYWTRRARQRRGFRRALVFGAGEGGQRLIRGLLAERASRIVPAGLIDDDPAKSRLRIQGVPVLGGRASLAEAVTQTGASLLIIATPSADSNLLREVTQAAADAGLDVKILPSLGESIHGVSPVHGLRDLDVADLLGRSPVTLDSAAVAEQITGRRVLVTGAGGSIGAELARQIARFSPARLYLLDRDESGLQSTQMSLRGHGLLDSDDVILADIRDRARMVELCAEFKPDMVFHAAALKHLPLLERYPSEAWKTNVLGTLNVLHASAAAGVGTFVNISTDKAASPTSVLGVSKRITERLTAHYAQTQLGRYVSVRFGNVLGSRGSVVHAFTAQIERGGPVTVTHPDVQRYFMLIPEACQLVLQAAAIGGDADVMVLDMGQQVRIVEVARTLIAMSGRAPVDIVFTGLRPGEKLSEDLFDGMETHQATEHPRIRRVSAQALAPERLVGGAEAAAGGVDDLVDWMRRNAGTTPTTGDGPPRPGDSGDFPEGTAAAHGPSSLKSAGGSVPTG